MTKRHAVDGEKPIVFISRRFPRNLKLIAALSVLLCIPMIMVWGLHTLLVSGALVLAICVFRRRTVLRLDVDALSFDNGFVVATAPRQGVSQSTLRGLHLTGRTLTVEGDFSVELKYNKRRVSRRSLVISDDFGVNLEAVAKTISTWVRTQEEAETP